MNYSVLTKVTNDEFNGQQFYLYESGEEGLAVLSKEDADKLVEILSGYPNVFSEIEAIPRENEEIKLLDPSKDSDGLSLSMQDVLDYCPGLLEKLEENFDHIIVGIDRLETVRQTFENN
ncbi:hypothetical protein [Flavobacterium sp. UBA7682]|uniref:hypothetical protein n=1 Tax=Flavobacterium sp. UBA7682 TaxID=1946560 RepID=UPI0025C036AD|nr:hypothetical protein [Flavobacterium sp. UBA7682]